MSDQSKEITKLLADLEVPFTASKAAGTDEVAHWKVMWPSTVPGHGDYEIAVRLLDHWVFISRLVDIPDDLKENTQFLIGLLRLNARGGQQKIAFTETNKIAVWVNISDAMISPPFFNQTIASVARISDETIKLIDENRTV